MILLSERLKCSETRKDGQPCGAWATTTGKCAGHSRLGIAADPRANQERAAEVRRAKAIERGMTFQDHLAAELEKEAANYVATMRKAASEGDWRALETWTTRVLGKPIERVETTENSLNPASMSSEQRAELRRKLVQDNPELLELVPAAEHVTKSQEHGLQDVKQRNTA